jgi:hypothetical protein
MRVNDLGAAIWGLAMAATACGNGPSSPASVRSEEADADGTEQPGADAKATSANTTDSGADASGGVNGIYKACPAVTLTQHYVDPAGFTLDYPSTWTESSSDATTYAFTEPYSYLPTGSPKASAEEARILAFVGTDSDTMTAAQAPDQYAACCPNDVVRKFTINGRPAVAWWYDQPPAQCGACPGPGDPGPDLISINLAVANGRTVIQLNASARANAPDDIFCQIQAIEASLTFQ